MFGLQSRRGLFDIHAHAKEGKGKRKEERRSHRPPPHFASVQAHHRRALPHAHGARAMGNSSHFPGPKDQTLETHAVRELRVHHHAAGLASRALHRAADQEVSKEEW